MTEIADGSVGILVRYCRGRLVAGGLGEIGGANVTVSRTDAGLLLCFQIITTLHRFGDKQGRALFSDTCAKQPLSCPPKFNIAGCNLHPTRPYTAHTSLQKRSRSFP